MSLGLASYLWGSSGELSPWVMPMWYLTLLPATLVFGALSVLLPPIATRGGSFGSCAASFVFRSVAIALVPYALLVALWLGFGI